MDRKQTIDDGFAIYVQKCIEQEERTERITENLEALEETIFQLWEDTDVEHGCWVPRDERIEWLNKMANRAVKKVLLDVKAINN